MSWKPFWDTTASIWIFVRIYTALCCKRQEAGERYCELYEERFSVLTLTSGKLVWPYSGFYVQKSISRALGFISSSYLKKQLNFMSSECCCSLIIATSVIVVIFPPGVTPGIKEFGHLTPCLALKSSLFCCLLSLKACLYIDKNYNNGSSFLGCT